MSDENNKPVIAVVGATGAQGGAVVNALLENGKFAVRAITRKPDSEKAMALSARDGVEVVCADIDDVDSLIKAFDGAYGAFFLTNFWEIHEAEKEMQHYRNLAEAGKAANLKHVVNSTMEDSRPFYKNNPDIAPPTLQGDMFIPHMDGKGSMNKVVSESVPATHLNTSFYFEAFHVVGPKKDEKGEAAINFNLGDKVMPMVAVKDIGRVAAKIFEDESLIGKELYVSSTDQLNGSAMAELFHKVLGSPVKYNAVPFDIYRSLGFPFAEEVANMFKFKADDDGYRSRRFDDSIVAKLVPDRITLEEWCVENKDALIAAMG